MRCPSLATVACVVAAVLCSVGCRESAKTMRTFSHGLARHDDDDLLTRIRASLADGEIEPSLLQALMASDDPAHARARRIFEAMQGADPATPAASASGEGDESVALVPTPLAVVQRATEAATPSAAASAQPQSSKSSSRSRTPTPAPATRGARPKIKSMALRPSGKGATLTLRANSGVLVGVVNQRRSGLVRLVVDASADPATLRARPSVKGAKVTTIRRVGDSIFVTLELDPGWALGRITKTSGGATVHLHPV